MVTPLLNSTSEDQKYIIENIDQPILGLMVGFASVAICCNIVSEGLKEEIQKCENLDNTSVSSMLNCMNENSNDTGR